jgi:hypothetical protein
MQHANRHREIERSVAIGQDIAVISLVFDVGMILPRLRDAGCGNIGAAQAAEQAARERMKRADTAADVESGRLVAVAEMTRHEVAQNVRLGGHEEVVR